MDEKYAAVEEAHRYLTIVQGRSAGEWARMGLSVEQAQVWVTKARKDYASAFSAYVQTLHAA